MTQAPLLPHVFYAAEAPQLPVRNVHDKGGPCCVTRARLAERLAQGVRLAGTTQTGEVVAISLTIVAPGVARVLIETEPGDPQRITLARKEAFQPVPVTLHETTGQITLKSGSISLQIELDPFHLAFCGPDGQVTLEQDRQTTDVTGTIAVLPCGLSLVDDRRVAFHDSFVCEPDEHFYGLGEQFTEFDKRGQRVQMWSYDAYGAHTERAYKPVPFFVSSRGYGIFVDSTTCVHFDLGKGNHAALSLVVPDSALDYYVIVGPEPKTIISRYADLVSHPLLPPKWSFGLWMSSGFKDDSADEVLRRARALREHGVPCDVLHLDCYWQRFGRWSELLWDREKFPDPEDMLRQVKALGFKVCLWMNPYIGTASERFVEARDKGYLLKTPDGEAYVCQLWGNYHPPVGIIDVFNPAAAEWLRSLLRPLLRTGVDVFKTDFGEGVPADAVAYNGLTGERLHNLYPLVYNDLVAGVTAAETGRAGLVWGRSTYAGGQRHAAQWSGDPNCTYPAMASTLRGGLSLAMCGHAFWSHDIGGFYRQPTPELYVRWAQFGLFSPMARAHGVTSRLPWDYGEEALRLFRDYVRLRYRLVPYLYSYASLAARTGLPIMRPMLLEFPDDPNTYHLDLQYMLGAELLVAPVYNSSGRRPIYFPAGRWVDYWTHEVIVGPQAQWITAPLEKLPLYVRADALVPTVEPAEHMEEVAFPFVIFDAYVLERGAFELYDLDGTTQVSVGYAGRCLEVRAEGAKANRLGLRLMRLAGATTPEHVVLNGRPLPRCEGLTLTPEAKPGWSVAADGTLLAVLGPITD